jgi:hypothetical protein
MRAVAFCQASDDPDTQHRFHVRKLHKQSVRINEEAKPDCKDALMFLIKQDKTINPI